MKSEFKINDKKAEINCTDDLTINELEVAKEMLSKLIDCRIIELKEKEQNKLPLTADIGRLYPELSTRTRNVLKRSGCNTIGDVLNCTYTDLENMRNMGKNSLEEIKERFSKYGCFKESGE